MNQELVTTYNVIKNNVNELIASLQKHINTKEYFLTIRAADLGTLSDIEIASRFIFLNRTAFNGMYRVNKSGGFNVPFGSYAKPLICDEDNLHTASSALKDVTIEHQDYKNVLENTQQGDFIYFDSPYFPISKTFSFTSYTAGGFLEKNKSNCATPSLSYTNAAAL